MGTHEVDPAFQFRCASFAQRGTKSLEQVAGLGDAGPALVVIGVGAVYREHPPRIRGVIGPGDRGVCIGDRSREIPHQCLARADDLDPEGDEFVIPHIQGREGFSVQAPGAGRLQQRPALLEFPCLFKPKLKLDM